MADSTTQAEVRPGTPRGKKLGRWLAALLLLLAVLAVLFTAFQAVQARAALKETAASLQQVRDAVADNDIARARQSLADAQDSAASARDNTRGPVWWLASKVPAVGDDVSAVRTVADVSHGLTHTVLPGLVEAGESLSPADLQPSGGRINVDAIERVAPKVVQADRQLDGQVDQVDAIETSGLISQIAGPVDQLRDALTEMRSVTDVVARAVQLLPPMLGAEGERNYLVLFQNNAETRATGGIPGAIAVITANDGRISLGRQGTASDLGIFDQPVVPLTRDEVALFDPKVAEFAQDINFTPDFPRSAQIAQEMWQRSSGMTVDGVVSTDPVGLSYLLEGTGPVDIPGGQTLTADNAVDVLLNDVYMNVADPERQNAIFAEAAQRIFEALTTGQGDPRAMLEGVAKVAQDERLLLWSAHRSEQALLSGTTVAGELPDRPTDQPAVGVYFNDGTGAKMGYYLDYDVRIASVSCDADASQRMRATVMLRSSAPPDARTLPESVIGPGFGARPGDIRINVLLYAPYGGKVGKATFNGQPLGYAPLQHDGRPVAATTVDIGPGQEHELTYEFASGPGQPGVADLRLTPGAQPGEDDGQVSGSACA